MPKRGGSYRSGATLKLNSQQKIDELDRKFDELPGIGEQKLVCERECPWYSSSYCDKYNQRTILGGVCIDEQTPRARKL